MPAVIITIGLMIVFATYWIVALRVGNYLHVMTPMLFFQIPAFYVFEVVNYLIAGSSGSIFAYTYCYATYTAGAVALALGYLTVPEGWVPILIKAPKLRVVGLPYLLLAIAWGLYLPILIRYRQFIGMPREIYIATRTGFGPLFFLSSFAAYLSLILLLFSGNRSRLQKVVFSTVALVLLYLHGSKGQILFFFLILLYFSVFVQQRKFSLGKLLQILGAVSFLVLLMFYSSFSDTTALDLAEDVAGYADYTRNAMLVIDDPDLPPQYGRLTAQESIYSLVPRAVFPDKPDAFGELWLAQRYFPIAFGLKTGAPAFGIGVLYADFGPFAILVYSLEWLVSGMVMKVLVSRLRRRPDAATFFLLLVTLQVPLIPAGADIPFLFYYLCALVVGIFSRDRLWGRPYATGLTFQGG